MNSFYGERIYLQLSFVFCEIAVLIDDAFGSFQEMFFGAVVPPIDQIAVQIELTPFIVETMGDFVADNETHCPIIQIVWTFGIEEHALQDASG